MGQIQNLPGHGSQILCVFVSIIMKITAEGTLFAHTYMTWYAGIPIGSRLQNVEIACHGPKGRAVFFPSVLGLNDLLAFWVVAVAHGIIVASECTNPIRAV